MKISDLQFSYPEALVATAPQYPPRVLLHADSGPSEEISLSQLLQLFNPGDVLVINNTRVLKRRVFAGDLEILFLNKLSAFEWEVLFPSRKFKLHEKITLPENVQMELIEKGRPQKVRTNSELNEDYFQRVAELPLPPYIQKAREQRHNNAQDESWYQTAWAKEPGSFAAPTASLHFKTQDIDFLRKRGVQVVELTLHVGLGTFLPVTAEDLDDHVMHEEFVQIPAATWSIILQAKQSQKRVWALGTTACRSVESAANGLLPQQADGGFAGNTALLIQPGYQFKILDALLTNFHQPESTLLALVAAFAGLEQVKACYRWAIERNFRLFSYGDLSVWIHNRKI